MFELKTTTAVLALLGTGYYGYSSLDNKFGKYDKLIADRDHKIQNLEDTLTATHESL